MRIAEHLAEIREALSPTNTDARLWLGPQQVAVSRDRKGVVTFTARTPLVAHKLRDGLSDLVWDWLTARRVYVSRVVVEVAGDPWAGITAHLRKLNADADKLGRQLDDLLVVVRAMPIPEAQS